MNELSTQAIQQQELLIAKIQTLKTGYEDAYKFAVRRISKCIKSAYSHTTSENILDVRYEKQILHKLLVCDAITVCLTLIEWYEQSDEYTCNGILQQAKNIINQPRRAA